MADVIIKGMEMPENCWKCVLRKGTRHNLMCYDLSILSPARLHSRPDGCPLRPAPEWISVEDRLPESDSEDMLIFGEWVGVSGTVHREIFFTSLDECRYHGVEPIAWMPRPELPEGWDTIGGADNGQTD